ncbi:DUF4158 domain-containing protein [Streptosporangium sp. NPDC006013]|uniref:DUF4158 domain-containing protein n=1 Tax=Streptosporangium sp. NPDC006013 TaxID=3155596 RepID=UPI0033B64BDB
MPNELVRRSFRRGKQTPAPSHRVDTGQQRDPGRCPRGRLNFAAAEAELRSWVDARAWTTEGGPKALFDAAVGWLRERRVLLPGVSALARLVAGVRDKATQRRPLRGTR